MVCLSVSDVTELHAYDFVIKKGVNCAGPCVVRNLEPLAL